MIRIKNVKNIQGEKQELLVPSFHDVLIDGVGLTCLPALIDPHVHFRVPGGEHKEDWKTGSLAAIRGGVGCVFDMPNNAPACFSLERLKAKKQMINAQLHASEKDLQYGLYLGADQNHLEEILKCKDEVVGIKIFMGCSTGDLLVDSDEVLEEVFKRASKAQLLIAVHAEEESILNAQKKKYSTVTDPSFHSKIRSREAAIVAVTKVIALSSKYNVPLYLLHMSTKEELELVRQAKKKGIPVYAEVTTHHLFLSEKDYARWGTFVQMNPPLRTLEDQYALWEGIRDGSIDTIGTDHAPHTKEEKNQPFGKAPSGIPGVETLLPLMLDAVSKGRLTLQRLVELTRTNVEKIFRFPLKDSWVLVDLDLKKNVELKNLSSKCGWSPYEGLELQGWPVYTILEGNLFKASGLANQKNGKNDK